MASEESEDGDIELLQRFLRGELDDAEIEAVEQRLDEDPALQRVLGQLASDLSERPVSHLGTTRIYHQFRATDRRPLGSGVILEEEIARGGMGIIHRAHQESVGRVVAVKSVRDVVLHSGPLVQEALVTGFLEHPNIVPIHDIVDSEIDGPQVVLKHIEGTVWRDSLVEAGEPGARPLEWHVRVLIQVCQALRFAHSRGVVHRDVKPANVMIGSFDEVYLLDWGLAVCLDDQPGMPTLAEAHGAAGTPAYMAPEQFEESPASVGLHTDIYLVGATLFHVVAGNPPQPGKKLGKIRDAVLSREGLALPEGTPAELAQIIERAMALRPEDRYPSMTAMRDALQGFLDHRASSELVRKGDAAMDLMNAAHDRRDAEASERYFFDAAFSYRAALETWADNVAARDSLDVLVHARVSDLLAIKAPIAAKRALAVMDHMDPTLLARVEHEVALEDQNRLRLRDYDRGDDRLLGLGKRRTLAFILGGPFIVFAALIGADPPTDAWPLVVGAVLFLIVSGTVVLRARDVMLDLRLNRYNVWIILSVQLAHIIVFAMAALTARPVAQTMTELLLIWALGAACSTVVIDVRILPTAVAFAAGYVATSLHPSSLALVLPGCATVMVGTSLAINWLTMRAGRKRGPSETKESGR